MIARSSILQLFHFNYIHNYLTGTLVQVGVSELLNVEVTSPDPGETSPYSLRMLELVNLQASL